MGEEGITPSALLNKTLSRRATHCCGAIDVMAPYDAQDDAEKARLEERYKPVMDLRSTFHQRTFEKAASRTETFVDEGNEFMGFSVKNPETRREPHDDSISDIPFFSGWLWKRYQGDGGGVHWKKRWFYLMDDRLCYTRTGIGNEKTTVKYIPLDRIALRAKWSPNETPPAVGIAWMKDKTIPPGLGYAGAGTGNDRCFQLQCGSVTHVLAAETETLAKRWLDGINKAWCRCVASCSRKLITTTEGERWKHEAARLQGELTHANETLAILGAEVGGVSARLSAIS